MSQMLSPATSMARHHVGSLVAVLLAVCGGSALVTAALVVGETGLTSHTPAARLSGADIVVSAPQSFPVAEDLDIALPDRVPLPGDLADRIVAVPGVATAANDLTLDASLTGVGPLPAHTWESSSLGDTVALSGQAPRAADEVVLDAVTARAVGLALGDQIEATLASAPATYRLVGIADAPVAGMYVQESLAARTLARPDGAVDLVAVAVTPGIEVAAVVEEIDEVLASAGGPEFVLSTGEERGDVELLAAGGARSELVVLTASMAGTLLFVVGCIVTSALTVAVANQRRDLALLRAVGATPRQVRGLVASQATAAAGVALVPGVIAGHLGAGALASMLRAGGVMPADLPLARTPWAGLVVVALTLLAVQFSARGAAWRTSRLPATEAVAESRVEPRQPSRYRNLAAGGALASGAGAALVPLLVGGDAALVSAASATLLGILAVALGGPAVVSALTRRASSRTRDRTPPVVWLAVKNAHAHSRRTAGVVTVLTLAVGLTLTQYYVQTTSDRAVGSDLEAGATADATIIGHQVPDDLRDLMARPTIRAAVPMLSTTVLHSHRLLGETTTTAYPVLALGRGSERVVDPGVVRGDLSELTGRTVALSTSTARTWRADVGEDVSLVLGDGSEARARVVALYDREFGFGGLIVSTDLLPGADRRQRFDTVLVDGDPAAADAWASARPGLTVHEGSVLIDRAGADGGRWISLMVVLAMFGYVLVGIANSSVASTLQRRQEFAALRVIGATRRQVVRMMLGETALLALLAIGGGLLVSLVPLTLLGLGIAGAPWPQGTLWVIPAVALVVTLTAFGAILVATGRALRLG